MKERQKLNYELHVILMQKGIVVFVLANYLDDVLVWNYAMSGLRGDWIGGNGFLSRLYSCLKLPEIHTFAYKSPNRQAVALRKCQLAGHNRAVQKTKYVSQCLRFAKIAIRQCKHGCKKKKKRKKRKGKDDRTLIRSNLTYFDLTFCGPERIEKNGNHKRFVDTSIHPCHCKVCK